VQPENGTVQPEVQPESSGDDERTGPPSFLANPVCDFPEVEFPQQETPIREYLAAMPQPDDSGNWNIEAAKTWLNVSTVNFSFYLVFSCAYLHVL
jgi:hypothetical protein